MSFSSSDAATPLVVSVPSDYLLAKPQLQAALRLVLEQVYGTAIERAARLAFADVSLQRAAKWIDAEPSGPGSRLEQRLLAGFDLLDVFGGVSYRHLRSVYQTAFPAQSPDTVTLLPMSMLRDAVDAAVGRLDLIRLCSTGIPRRPSAATVRAVSAWFA